MVAEEFKRTCPNCGKTVPIYFGFRTWCEHCEWNVEENSSNERPKGFFLKIWQRLSNHSAENNLKKVLASNDLRPSITISLVLAYLVSFLVHGFTLFLVFGAVQLFLTAISSWGKQFMIVSLFHIAAAVVLSLIVWKIHPHFVRVPKDCIRREQAPSLFRLIDRVAKELNAPVPTSVAFTPDFDASIGDQGFMRGNVLFIGFPCFYVLERQEFLSMLAHELAHGVNGDPMRTWIIGGAIHTLFEWYDLFWINLYTTMNGAGLAALLSWFIQAVSVILTSISWLFGGLLALLLFPNMQRAEFLADGLAAQLAGTKSSVSALRKMYLREVYFSILRKASHDPATNVFPELCQTIAKTPDREMRRIDILLSRGKARLDSTHPPTGHRVKFLEGRSLEIGKISLLQGEFDCITAEIARFEEEMEKKIKSKMARGVAS